MIGRGHQAMSHTKRAMLPQLELGEAYQAEGGDREAVGHSEESLPILRTIQSRLELEQSVTAHGRYYCSLFDAPNGIASVCLAIFIFYQSTIDEAMPIRHLEARFDPCRSRSMV